MDEQNAQTQEHQGFVLGLSESEEKKELKLDDRVCPGESCGAAKTRSLRKGVSPVPHATLGCPFSESRPP